jgi:hypothetical protein
VDARNANFDDGSSIDPFAGLSPALTPEEEQRQLDARRAQLRADSTRTANINAPYQQQRGTAAAQNTVGSSVADLERRQRQGDPLVTPEVLAAARKSERDNHRAMNTGAYKALTYGILAAPAAVTGGAAAFGGPGALGFGAGTGSIAAADAGTAAAESAAASTPAITTGGAMTAPTLAAPAATGAAAAPAAAAGSVPSWVSDGAALGGKLATAAAPFLIQEALGGKTKEEKALIAKQEQIAREAKVRQGQQQDARMNQLGQQLLAFNPSNQLMAQMYGPGAAFQPEQMAAMAQGQKPAYDEKWSNYKGTDPKVQKDIEEYIRRKKEYDAAEASRHDMLMGGIQRPGPGPTPIQMSAPQAARRY